MHPIRFAGGLFTKLHDGIIGPVPDLSGLRAEDHDPALWRDAQKTWADRVLTEFRSTQILNRFLGDVLASGDPLDTYAIIHDLVLDEIRHVAISKAVCDALGVQANFPTPIHLETSEGFANAPFPQRALTTAISMLAINETISVGFIADLQARCAYAPIRAVLDATLSDEADHEAFGWEYVKASLSRFPATSKGVWRQTVQQTLAPHRKQADALLANVPEDKRTLDAWPDTDRVRLGMFSAQRQALVFEKTYKEKLAPQLLALDLL